jgi:xanthosine utilization system XapX-like protein
MDSALSLLLSAGIAAFGVCITGYTIASGSPPGWTLMGILSIMVGSISLFQAIGEARLA